MLELPGAKAMDPMASAGWASVTGVQLVPASGLSQTPPLAVPSSQWLGFDGSTAAEVMRPVGPELPVSGAGPMLVHTCAWQSQQAAKSTSRSAFSLDAAMGVSITMQAKL